MPGFDAQRFSDLSKLGTGLGDGYDFIIQLSAEGIGKILSQVLHKSTLTREVFRAINERPSAVPEDFRIISFKESNARAELIQSGQKVKATLEVSMVSGLSPNIHLDGTIKINVPIVLDKEPNQFRIRLDMNSVNLVEDDVVIRNNPESKNPLSEKELKSLTVLIMIALDSALKGNQQFLLPPIPRIPTAGVMLEDLEMAIIEHPTDDQQSVLSLWGATLDYEIFAFGHITEVIKRNLDQLGSLIFPAGGIVKVGGASPEIRSDGNYSIISNNWEIMPNSISFQVRPLGVSGDPAVIIDAEIRIKAILKNIDKERAYQSSLPLKVVKRIAVNGKDLFLDYDSWGPEEAIGISGDIQNEKDPFFVNGVLSCYRKIREDLLGNVAGQKLVLHSMPFEVAGLGLNPQVLQGYSGIRVFAKPVRPRGNPLSIRNHVPKNQFWAIVVDNRFFLGLMYEVIAGLSVMTAGAARDKYKLYKFKSSLSEGQINADVEVVDVGLKNLTVGRVTGFVGLRFRDNRILIDDHLDVSLEWWIHVASVFGIGLSFFLFGYSLTLISGIVFGGFGALEAIIMVNSIAHQFDQLINEQIERENAQAGGGVSLPVIPVLGSILVPIISNLEIGERGIKLVGTTEDSLHPSPQGSTSQPLRATHRIVQKLTGRKPRTIGYRFAAGHVLSVEQLVALLESGGKFPGIHLVHRKDGNPYLRANPDSTEQNNLSKLPVIKG